MTLLPYKGELTEAWKGEAVPAKDDVAPIDKESEEFKKISKIGKTIFVLTKGLRYADVAEWRRQQRYAVQAALWAKGYSPVQADQLSYRDLSFRTIFGKGKGTETVKPGQDWLLRLPYEDFRDSKEDAAKKSVTSEKSSSTRIRVCYVNLNLINSEPLGAVCRIAEALGLAETDITLTSPPTTDWLEAMVWEKDPVSSADREAQGKAENLKDEALATAARERARMAKTKMEEIQRWQRHTSEQRDATPNDAEAWKQWMSATAQLDQATILFKEADAEAKKVRKPVTMLKVFNTLATGDIKSSKGDLRGKSFRSNFRISPGVGHQVEVKIHQMIEPDSKTIQLIQREFRERTLDIGGYDWLKGGPCTVAIVSEWETSFGRKFAHQMLETGDTKDAVVQFNYLRGLGGLTPDGRASGLTPEIQIPGQRAAEARTPGEALSRSIEPPPLPPPYGLSQFDYIARLGENLKRANGTLRREGRGEIRAIGLIGTDIDDKLALLKVLRPRFPDALFFTNEMNADFFQPENNPFTRNLIIATHYSIDGSDLGSTEQFAKLPVFRTSSQVALVDSIWAALSEVAAPQFPKRRVQLYEVGLRQWHELKFDRTKSSADVAQRKQILRHALFLLGGGMLLLAIVVGLCSDASSVPLLRDRLATFAIGALSWLQGPAQAGFCGAVKPFVVWLLGARPKIETNQIRALSKGAAPLPCPAEEGPSEKSGAWWLSGAVAVVLGLVWAATGQIWGSSVMAICSLLALAWMALTPRQDHRKIAWALIGCAALLCAAVTSKSMAFSAENREPLSMADGVCLWPAVVLRLLAAGLALNFIRLAWADLCRLRDDLTRRFFLEYEGGIKGGIRYGKDPERWEKGKYNGLVLRDFPDHTDLDQGSNPAASNRPKAANEAVEWISYLDLADPRKAQMLKRWGRLTLASLLLAAVAMLVAGFPSASCRGGVAKLGDIVSLSLALGCLTLLCVFVGDQLWQCRKFIRKIWVHGTTGFGFETEETILLVARLTKGVGDLLVFPFAVCFILLCAHSGFFERWLGLNGLYAMLALALGALITLAWKMQRAAHEARSRTVAYLQLNLAEASWLKRLVYQRVDFQGADEEAEKGWWKYTLRRLGRHLTLPEQPRILEKFAELEEGGAFGSLFPGGSAAGQGFGKAETNDLLEKERAADVRFHNVRIERIKELIALVNSIKEGAFGGIRDNPIVHGVLIPSVGLGSLELIQRLLVG